MGVFLNDLKKHFINFKNLVFKIKLLHNEKVFFVKCYFITINVQCYIQVLVWSQQNFLTKSLI